jgi:hypothetical protein
MRNIVKGTAIDERRVCRVSPAERYARAVRPARRAIIAFAALFAVAVCPALAHGPNQPPHQN